MTLFIQKLPFQSRITYVAPQCLPVIRTATVQNSGCSEYDSREKERGSLTCLGSRKEENRASLKPGQNLCPEKTLLR